MRICDITMNYTPTGGGIKTYINEKQRYLQDETDWSHQLIVPGPETSDRMVGRLWKSEIASPYFPGAEPYRMIFDLESVQARLEAFRPDVIELLSPYTLPWAAFRYRKKHPETRIVGFYLTDYPDAYVEPTVRAVRPALAAPAKFLATKYVGLVFGNCDLTVTSGQPFVRKLQRYGVKQVEYVPLGVDTQLFNPDKRDDLLRQRFGIGPDDLMLLYAGRLDSEKRVELLPEALKRLPPELNARLVIAGEGPLRETLVASGSRDVIVLPYITEKKELARLMASADIYVNGHPHETFGLSVLEAQSSGLPVVGVRSGAMIERVDDHTGLLGRVNCSQDMARNIEKLSQMDFRQVGGNARRVVETSYSWDCTFEKMVAHYERLRGDHGKEADVEMGDLEEGWHATARQEAAQAMSVSSQ